MSHDDAAAVRVMRAMVAAFDDGDVSRIAEIVHPEYVDHQGLPGERPIIGVEGFIRVVGVARSGYTELAPIGWSRDLRGTVFVSRGRGHGGKPSRSCGSSQAERTHPGSSASGRGHFVLMPYQAYMQVDA